MRNKGSENKKNFEKNKAVAINVENLLLLLLLKSDLPVRLLTWPP
jgi:hypothetical protein